MDRWLRANEYFSMALTKIYIYKKVPFAWNGGLGKVIPEYVLVDIKKACSTYTHIISQAFMIVFWCGYYYFSKQRNWGSEKWMTPPTVPLLDSLWMKSLHSLVGSSVLYDSLHAIFRHLLLKERNRYLVTHRLGDTIFLYSAIFSLVLLSHLSLGPLEHSPVQGWWGEPACLSRSLLRHMSILNSLCLPLLF